MAKLTVNTDKDIIYIVGDYNGWSTEDCLRFNKRKGAKNIIITNMPIGEYKILCEKTWCVGEELDGEGNTKPNRFFEGKSNETVLTTFR